MSQVLACHRRPESEGVNPLTVQAVRYLETDGCLYMGYSKRGTATAHAFPRVSFAQAAHRAIPMMDLLDKGFGIKGSRHWLTKGTARKGAVMTWQTNQRNVWLVVSQALPHLIVKRQQFQLAYEFLELFEALPDRGPSGRKRWTPELRAHSLELHVEMAHLNRKGRKE